MFHALIVNLMLDTSISALVGFLPYHPSRMVRVRMQQSKCSRAIPRKNAFRVSHIVSPSLASAVALLLRPAARPLARACQTAGNADHDASLPTQLRNYTRGRYIITNLYRSPETNHLHDELKTHDELGTLRPRTNRLICLKVVQLMRKRKLD